jgi:hypothetical protein
MSDLPIPIKPAPRRQRVTVVLNAHYTNPDDPPYSKRAAFEYGRALEDDAVSESASRKRLAVPAEYAIAIEPPTAPAYVIMENTGDVWVRIENTSMAVPPKAAMTVVLQGPIYVKADAGGSQISLDWFPL